MSKKGELVAAAVVLVISLHVAEAADVVVLESNAPGYPAGRTLSADASIKLVAGEGVLLVTEDARMLRIEGPYDGPAVGVPPDEDAVRKAIDRMVSASTPRVGGMGAVRGIEAGDLVIDTRPEPWLLHAELGGEQCVLRDRPIELWRESPGEAAAAQVAAVGDDAVAVVRWNAGAARALWPAAILPVADGRTYSVRFEPAIRSVTITLRLLDPAVAGNGLAAAAWLAARGCTNQVRVALR